MKSKLRPWLVLAVIFIAGAVTGAALTIGFASHWMQPPGAQQMRNNWMMHLTHRLNLTADQQAKIEPILADAGNQLQSLHRDEVEKVSQIMEKTNSQIAAILTPDQQAELQKMEKEMDQNRDRMFPGHHHWGQPPDGH